MEIERKGLLFGVLAAMSYALMATSVKLASSVNNETLVFFRTAICFFCILPFMWKQKISLKTTKPFLHILRAVFGVATLYASFYAAKNLLLMDAVLLYNTVPLFMPFLFLLFLKEPIPFRRLLIVLVGFVGVVAILKPSFSFANVAGIIGLCSGFTGAIALFLVQRMAKTDPSERIVFYFFLSSMIISFFPMIYAWKPIVSLFAWMCIALVGVFAFLYQFFITKAYSYVHATKISFSSYLAVLFGGLFDVFFWHRTPDVFSLIGAFCIVGGGMLLLLEKKPIETT